MNERLLGANNPDIGHTTVRTHFDALDVRIATSMGSDGCPNDGVEIVVGAEKIAGAKIVNHPESDEGYWVAYNATSMGSDGCPNDGK